MKKIRRGGRGIYEGDRIDLQEKRGAKGAQRGVRVAMEKSGSYKGRGGIAERGNPLVGMKSYQPKVKKKSAEGNASLRETSEWSASNSRIKTRNMWTRMQRSVELGRGASFTRGKVSKGRTNTIFVGYQVSAKSASRRIKGIKKGRKKAKSTRRCQRKTTWRSTDLSYRRADLF